VVVSAQSLRRLGALTKSAERVRFARQRCGHSDVIDVLAALSGSAVSGERTLEEFYERVQPFAHPFMAFCERDRRPSRSVLSHLLAARTPELVEALRTLFLDNLLERRPDGEHHPCGRTDRTGQVWTVFALDGTVKPLDNGPCQTHGLRTEPKEIVSTALEAHGMQRWRA
jgi:hypothetical protein